MTTHVRLRPTRLVATAVLSLALAGSLSACGGNDETSTTSSDSTTTPSTDPSTDTGSSDTFVADANAVCQGLYPDINGVATTLDPADPTLVTTDFLPLVQELQDQLSALTPPDDLAADYEQALANQQTALDTITADPAALFTLDSTETDAIFDGIGITTCGSASVDVAPSRSAGGASS